MEEYKVPQTPDVPTNPAEPIPFSQPQLTPTQLLYFKRLLTTSNTAAGSDTEIQFNDGGSFGGDANFTWDGSTLDLYIKGGGEIFAGNNTGSNNGDSLSVLSGQSGTSGGNGGQMLLGAGSSRGGNGTGGQLSIYSGDGVGSGSGGEIDITAGNGGSTGNGGSVKILLGVGNGGGTNGRLNIKTLPTSSVGLVTGDIWNNSGVLNIV